MKTKTVVRTIYSPDIRHFFEVEIKDGSVNVSTGFVGLRGNTWSSTDLRAAAETLLIVANILEEANKFES